MALLALFLVAAFNTPLASAQAWSLIEGPARDVGVGADGSVWVIGTAATPGGYLIYRRSGSSWANVPGGAERIAVDPAGNAWVVNSTQTLFRFDGANWVALSAKARDVGIGANGTAWIIGNVAEPGGYGIWRSTDKGASWNKVPGGAIRVAVDPAGNAWVVNSNNTIFRFAGSDWVSTPGAAKDIGVGADGSVWITRADDGIARWSGSDWTQKTGAAVQMSVGPDGSAWVVNAGGQIYHSTEAQSDQGAAIGSSSVVIPISGTVANSIDVTPVTIAETVPQSEAKLVFTGPIAAPAVAQAGALQCPIIGAGPKLLKDCLFVPAVAAFKVGAAPSQSCATGSFFDPENGGECWSCPTGYIRNVSPISSKDACWKAVTEDVQVATKTGTTGCPSGSFSDPRNGGECWSCPSGFNRTWDPVTAGTACSKSWAGPFSAATFIKKPGSCASSSFFDPQNGGECWSCPSGYRRTLYAVSDSRACAKTIETQYAQATLETGCASYPKPTKYGTPFRDPQNGGECWVCPLQYARSVKPVSGSEACYIKPRDDVFRKFSQYPEPGIYAFTGGLVNIAFGDPKQADAFITKRAGGSSQQKSLLWEKMASSPADSAEFKALLFAALLTEAKRNPKSPAVTAFEDYMKARHQFVVSEALSMYDDWQAFNGWVQWNAARKSSGYAMTDGVMGLNPGDYYGLAVSATGPDQRGEEFIDALTTLGTLSMDGRLASVQTSSALNFDPSLLTPVWMGIDKALDIYSAAAKASVAASTGAGKIVGHTMNMMGRGAAIAAAVVSGTIELGFAIDTLSKQEEAKAKYAALAADANNRIIVGNLMAGSADDQAQLAYYWSLATAGYKPGDTVEVGALDDKALCSAGLFQQTHCDDVKRMVRSARSALAAPAAPLPTQPRPVMRTRMETSLIR